MNTSVVSQTPRESYDSDEHDFAEAPWRVLIDFNFMQYSVTVVTYRATSSKFKPLHLRRMQGVKGPHQNSTSPVVDFYVLQFKDPLVRPGIQRCASFVSENSKRRARASQSRTGRTRTVCLRSGMKVNLLIPASGYIPGREEFVFYIQGV